MRAWRHTTALAVGAFVAIAIGVFVTYGIGGGLVLALAGLLVGCYLADRYVVVHLYDRYPRHAGTLQRQRPGAHRPRQGGEAMGRALAARQPAGAGRHGRDQGRTPRLRAADPGQGSGRCQPQALHAPGLVGRKPQFLAWIKNLVLNSP